MITPTRVFADRSDANRYFIEFEHVVGVRTLRHGEVIDVANLGSCRVDSAEPCAAHITALPLGGQGIVTHVAIVLDESFSMLGCAGRTISALNEYLGGLRQQTNRYRVTLASFNTNGTKFRYVNQDIREILPMVDGIDYVPAGGTPLYDATADVISHLTVTKGSALAMLIVLTDGEENSSRYTSQYQIQSLIRQKQAEGWAVIFLGADLSREEVRRYSQAMGMDTANAASYGKASTGDMFHTMAGATQGFVVSGGATASNTFQRDAESLKKGAATLDDLKQQQAQTRANNQFNDPSQQQQQAQDALNNAPHPPQQKTAESPKQ